MKGQEEGEEGTEEVEERRERGEQLGKKWEGKRRKFCVIREERGGRQDVGVGEAYPLSSP